MPGGRKQQPKWNCRSRFGGRGVEEPDVEDPAGREEEPVGTEETARSGRLRSRRLEFETMTTTTGDGGSGSGGGSSCGGGGDDDDDDDDGGHCDGGDGEPSSGSRKLFERGPSTLPSRKPLPHHRKVISPVGDK
jgi:hypothetical protein